MHCKVRAPAAIRNCSKVLSQPAPSCCVESRRWAQLCQTLWVRTEKIRAPKLTLPPIAGRTLELVPAPDPQGQMNVISEKQDKLVLYDQPALFMEAFSSEIKWTIPIAYCKNRAESSNSFKLLSSKFFTISLTAANLVTEKWCRFKSILFCLCAETISRTNKLSVFGFSLPQISLSTRWQEQSQAVCGSLCGTC